MNARLETIDLNEFNDYLRLKSDEIEDVNYIQMVAMSQAQKLSITCEYKKCDEYITYGSAQNPVLHVQNPSSDDFYYGLSPEVSSDTIFNAILGQEFSNATRLENFLGKYHHSFMLHMGQERYMEALFVKCVLNAASHFGVQIFFESDDEFASFTAFLERNNLIFIKGSTYKLGERVVDFLGCLTDEGFYALEQSGFYLTSVDDRLLVTSIPSNETFNFRHIYEQKPQGGYYLRLIRGKVYYSGTLPRALKIKLIENDYSNSDIKRFIFEIERTSFAMLDLCDYSVINQHPLLSKYKKLLMEFDFAEDESQKILFDHNPAKGEFYHSVNQYLSASPNTHSIGVSANLESNDDYLIITEREIGNIDGELYYCSANGQSEIYDSKVDFYKNSVYEDLPTLHIEGAGRIDFEKELERETIAELGVPTFSSNWYYYGVSILGVNNKNNPDAVMRRMHFNVLASNQLGSSLREVVEKAKNATESFENNKIIGIKIFLYEGLFNRLSTMGLSLLHGMKKNYDIIGAILAAVYFFMSPKDQWQLNVISFNQIYAIVSFLLSVLLILFLITKIYDHLIRDYRLNKLKKSTSGRVRKAHFMKTVDECISKLGIKRSSPIFLIMFALRCLEKRGLKKDE